MEVVREVIREVEVVREVPMPGPGTVVVDKPLRSGQQVYARGADLVVMAVVSFGAEVIADGNIHVYAPLRGRAIAGARATPRPAFSAPAWSRSSSPLRASTAPQKPPCPTTWQASPPRFAWTVKKTHH